MQQAAANLERRTDRPSLRSLSRHACSHHLRPSLAYSRYTVFSPYSSLHQHIVVSLQGTIMLKPRKFEVRKGPPPEPIKKSNSSSQINGQPRSKSGTPRSSNSQNQPSHQRPTTNSPARAAALVGRKPQSSSLRASSSTPTSGKRGRADLDIPRDRKKSRTATPTRVPSDSSSENEGDDGDDFMRVFQTVGGNRNDSPQVVDRKRRLWLGLDDTLENGTIKSETDSATSDPKKIIHGKHLTSTDHEHQYLPLFPDTTGRAIAELQYPGSLNSRER